MDKNYKFLYEYFNDIKKDERGRFVKKIFIEIQKYVEDVKHLLLLFFYIKNQEF